MLRSAFDVLRTNLQPLLTEDELTKRIGHVPLFLTPGNWGTWFEDGVTPANCPRKVRCARHAWLSWPQAFRGVNQREPPSHRQPQEHLAMHVGSSLATTLATAGT